MVRPEEKSARDYKPQGPDNRPGWLDMFPNVPEPKTELARYRILSPTCSLKVSPLCIGAMSFGDQWTGYMAGKLSPDESEKYLDAYYEAGGNFIDTACNYQDEQSEMIIGEWMEKRKNRDEMVVATKYTTFGLDRAQGKFGGIRANYFGNGKKSLALTLESSLRKLRTTYIDILYIHWWDYTTSIPEVMQSLNDVVKSGKVLFLGISDTPAWIVSEANQYARDHGLAQFVLYQGLWNLGKRDMERDIIPMTRANGMGIAPWGVLGQGKFKSAKELKEKATFRGGAKPTEDQLKVSEVLEEVASEIGGKVSLAAVGLAWARQTVADRYPIIGGTNIDHLNANIESLKIHLTEDQMTKLNNAVPFDWGFPYNPFGRDPHYLPEGKADSGLVNSSDNIKYVNYP